MQASVAQGSFSTASELDDASLRGGASKFECVSKQKKIRVSFQVYMLNKDNQPYLDKVCSPLWNAMLDVKKNKELTIEF